MFLCTDLFISTQHWANKGPNSPLTIVALMTQHYPADPEINFSIFNYTAHALHTLWQQAAGEARGSFSQIWCLVSFRSCLIEVKWLVMCCAMSELLILRITAETGSEENMIVFANNGLHFIITKHSMRWFTDQVAVLLSLWEYRLHLSALETTALFDLEAWACQQ